MNLINDLTFTSLETIDLYELSGDFIATLDELQNATIGNTEDKQEVTGKNGRKLTNIKRNKGVTVSGANGLVSGGLLEVQTGGTFENKDSTEIMWTDYLVVNSQAASTNYKGIGTEGAEIDTLYIRKTDGTKGDEMTQGSAVAANTFTYDPSTKALAFNTDVTDGTEIVVKYKRKIKAAVLENTSGTFSKKVMMYIDALGEDKCGNIYHIQFYIPKADFSGQFDIEIGDSQTVHNFEAESLAGACGVAGAGELLWTYTVFGVDTADVA